MSLPSELDQKFVEVTAARPPAALPAALAEAVEHAPARLPADREDARGALPVLRHAVQASAGGLAPAGALRTSILRTLVVAPLVDR